MGRTVAGAVRATVESGQLSRALGTAPLQALARLHTAAAASLVDAGALGRPRVGDEQPRDLPGPGTPPSGQELHARLDALTELLTLPGDVPALVVAALAHGEVMAMRPFVAGNGVVARALFRAVVVERGLDPTGVAVPEHAVLAGGLPVYAAALTGYVGGSPDGVAGGWCTAGTPSGSVPPRASGWPTPCWPAGSPDDRDRHAQAFSIAAVTTEPMLDPMTFCQSASVGGSWRPMSVSRKPSQTCACS